MGSPNQYDWCPYKKGKCGHRTGTHNAEFCEKTQREDSHMKKRIGGRHLQAKEHQRLPAKYQELES